VAGTCFFRVRLLPGQLRASAVPNHFRGGFPLLFLSQGDGLDLDVAVLFLWLWTGSSP
jgi:hypothetical protein